MIKATPLLINPVPEEIRDRLAILEDRIETNLTLGLYHPCISEVIKKLQNLHALALNRSRARTNSMEKKQAFLEAAQEVRATLLDYLDTVIFCRLIPAIDSAFADPSADLAVIHWLIEDLGDLWHKGKFLKLNYSGSISEKIEAYHQELAHLIEAQKELEQEEQTK